ncbi:MAG: hypothetical protein ACR2RE_20525 [Geminicoccaceae bacterium]
MTESPDRKIFYYSTLRGVSNHPDDNKTRVYYGKIVRHPKGEIDDNAKEAEEIGIREIESFIDGSHPDHGVVGGQFADGEFMERYEIHDIETGDLVVMWRLPFKPADAAIEKEWLEARDRADRQGSG